MSTDDTGDAGFVHRMRCSGAPLPPVGHLRSALATVQAGDAS
jgi:hypothetical protein